MKLIKVLKSGLLLIIFVILAISAIGFAYCASIYTEFVANKNSIFEKIENFASDLGKNIDSDITLGNEDQSEYGIIKRDSVFLDRNGSIIAKYSHTRRKLIPLREIPYSLTRGFILVEDQQFYQHFGINYERFALGIINNIITLGKSAGGSTISQQLAKILFTKQERSVKRKIYEIFCTIELEHRFTKNELLTIYLNSIYLGHGVYGIQDAANFYFDKDANELTMAESALLIGMNRSPERYSPIKSKENAEKVQRIVLNQFKTAGYIDENSIELEIARFWKRFDGQGVASNQSFWKTEINKSGYVTEYIRQILEKEFSYDKITEGGLIVETTIDLEKQNLAENIIRTQIKHIRNKIYAVAKDRNLAGYDEKSLSSVEASLASIDFKTGEILSLVGGSGYTFANQYNRAVYAKRSIGSSVKPFIYSYAFNQRTINGKDIQPFTKYKDELVTYNINGQKYTPRNYSGKQSGEMTTIYDALKRSLNTIPIALLNECPIKDVAEYIREASFLLDEKSRKRVPDVLSLALGTCEMSALELATAYAIFPRGGQTIFPIIIKKISDVKGNVYYDSSREHNPFFNDLYPSQYRESKSLINEAVAYEIVQMMRSVFEPGGTGYGAAFKTGFNIPAYGKSGTSQDYKDGIFAGYSDREVTITWVGMDSNKSILLPSESNSAIIWCEYMKQASRNYSEPITIPSNMKLVQICTKTGLVATDNCSEKKDFFFWVDGPIPEKCYIHDSDIF